MENKIKENDGEEKTMVNIKKSDLSDSSVTSNVQKLGTNVSVNVVDEDVSGNMIIDKPNQGIRYLSNVRDTQSGEVSQPFTVSDKKYQMVRGKNSENQLVMGVYCYDDLNETGENIIHSIEEFEMNVAKPMLAKENMDTSNVNNGPDTYEGFKHYLVDKETNEIRKFRTVEEILSSNKGDNESYMNTPKFKKYMNEKLFGASKRKTDVLNELTPNGEESDEESDEKMHVKAKKLMDMILKKVPSNIIDTIRTPVAQREVISAFAEMIGVPRNGLLTLINGLKDMAKIEATNENLVITKNQLLKSINDKKKLK
jgi:hypothetical protein